jgi:hypothetical protein
VLRGRDHPEAPDAARVGLQGSRRGQEALRAVVVELVEVVREGVVGGHGVVRLEAGVER